MGSSALNIIQLCFTINICESEHIGNIVSPCSCALGLNWQLKTEK